MADQPVIDQSARMRGLARFSINWPLLLGLFCAGAVLVVWQVHGLATRYFENRLAAGSVRTLELYAASLDGLLRKYQVLPEIYARDQNLLKLLDNPEKPKLITRANVVLEVLNKTAASMDTYLLDDQGLTLAASNWAGSKPFVGRNFSFRPYFQEAMKSGLGRYFAMGTTSLKRGYYFASRIWSGLGTKGVIVVKVDLSPLEKIWTRSPDQEVHVTDENGVIVLSTNPDWRFRATRKIYPDERERIARERKYNNLPIKQVNIKADKFFSAYQLSTYPGLTITLLTVKSKIQGEVWNVVLTVMLALLGAVLFAYWLYLRRLTYQRELKYREIMNGELEVRVHARTKELRSANKRLQHEVVERRRAETDLHKAQDELVHASKLAALGTLSASVGHELNQPIGAIRTYAENALKMMQVRDVAGPVENLGLIVALTDRAGRIVKNLKAFVGQQKRAPVVIDLIPPLSDALEEARGLFEENGVELVLDLGEGAQIVHGGKARLMQLFGNLISNAVAAMTDRPNRILSISVTRTIKEVVVTFSDTGAGFTKAALAQASEPFFTTKAHADGLGLGLSICENIMNSLDGQMTFANVKPHGATVSLTFRAVDEIKLDGAQVPKKIDA